MSTTTGAISVRPVSFAAPFRQTAFAVIWTATLVSNVGGWMYSAASGWLMTSLNPDPFVVALVQVADTLPICLLALPAGALADIFDKRTFLIVVEVLTTVSFRDLCGDGRRWLGYTRKSAAVFIPCQRRRSVDHTGVAICRATTRSKGRLACRYRCQQCWCEYFACARSRAQRCDDLRLWHRHALLDQRVFPISASSGHYCGGARRQGRKRGCLRNAFGQAVLAGLRYARFSPPLLATMMRAAGFFRSAAVFVAATPVARERSRAVRLYGALIGVIGTSALGGAFFLPWLKRKLGPDRLMAVGALGQAVAIVLYGLVRVPATAILASVVAGVSWIGVVATLTVSAQVALPDWVRARGPAL